MTMAKAESRHLHEELRTAGHRMTGPRRKVWEVLSAAESHLTAEQISVRIRGDDPTINLSSVYRSLALFQELGLVRESNLGSNVASHWELAHSDEQFHLKCASCGEVEHHGGDMVDQVREHLRMDHGFSASSVEILVEGLCMKCAGG